MGILTVFKSLQRHELRTSKHGVVGVVGSKLTNMNHVLHESLSAKRQHPFDVFNEAVHSYGGIVEFVDGKNAGNELISNAKAAGVRLPGIDSIAYIWARLCVRGSVSDGIHPRLAGSAGGECVLLYMYYVSM